MNDKTTTIGELREKVAKFVAARGWQKNQTARNLAASIAIEAAELLEHWQWDDVPDKDDWQEIKEELADTIIYCLSFANAAKIDIARAVADKLRHNAKKYPVTIFNKNRNKAADYHRIKKRFRRKKK